MVGLYLVLLEHCEEGIKIPLDISLGKWLPGVHLPARPYCPHTLSSPHLVHEHKGPLMAVVDIFIGRVSHTAMFHLRPACLQVAVPELVAKEQERQVKWAVEPQNPFSVLEATVVKRGLRKGEISQGRERLRHEGRYNLSGTVLQ